MDENDAKRIQGMLLSLSNRQRHFQRTVEAMAVKQLELIEEVQVLNDRCAVLESEKLVGAWEGKLDREWKE